MTDSDELEPLLGATEGPTSRVLQEAIRVRTGRVLWRRRVLRITGRLGAAAALFAAGFGVAGFTRTEVQPATRTETLVVPLLIPMASPAEELPSESIPAPRLEVQAEQTDDRALSAKLYRAAGDGYFAAEDYRNASRCYRLFVSRGGEAALQPAAADNWLLTSIKNALFQEKVHVAKTDG